MKLLVKPFIIVIVYSMTLVMLGGCAGVSHAGDFCMLYQPVYVVAEDTDVTKQQVDQNNVVWLELCR